MRETKQDAGLVSEIYGDVVIVVVAKKSGKIPAEIRCSIHALRKFSATVP